MSYHDIGRHVSGVPLALAEVGPVQGASKLLLRLHGAFMLTAWIGTASLGMLLARYFRQTWVGSQLCGKDQWFAVSSSMMKRVEPNLITMHLKFLVAQISDGIDLGSDCGWFCYHLCGNWRLVEGG